MSDHNKQKVSILIVDDDRTRDAAYQQFFARLAREKNSYYDIFPLLPQTPREALTLLLARQARMVVLDMVLSGDWHDNETSIYSQIKTLRCPVALLSANFNEEKVGEKVTNLLNLLADSPKLGFLPYHSSIGRHYCENKEIEELDAIPDDTVGLWNCMIGGSLQQSHQWQPNASNEVTFLHLTDTHFGEIQSDSLDLAGMGSGVKDDGQKADYVLWTGDITEHGYPDEFEKAYQFAQRLNRSELVSQSCPISITPGNHDLCRPLALASRLKTNEIPPSDKGAKTSWKWELKNTEVNAELKRFGFSPFREFFARLVGETFPEAGYRLLTYWKHLGFVILELPLEAHIVLSCSDQTPQPSPLISEIEFNEITNNVIDSFTAANLDTTVCVIVLIHGRDPDSAESNVSRWKQLVETICGYRHPVIVLGGHEHVEDCRPDRNCLTIIGTPLDEAKTDRLTLPGVGFIRLSGLAGGQLTCEVRKLEKYSDRGVSKWRLAVPEKLRINSETGHWISTR